MRCRNNSLPKYVLPCKGHYSIRRNLRCLDDLTRPDECRALPPKTIFEPFFFFFLGLSVTLIQAFVCRELQIKSTSYAHSQTVLAVGPSLYLNGICKGIRRCTKHRYPNIKILRVLNTVLNVNTSDSVSRIN